jgi:hypothetical protein
MPEPYWPKRNGSYTLADAAKHDTYASIRCTFCKRTRYYLVADLKTAFGDVECDDVVHVARLRCRNCNAKGSLELKMGGPPSDVADKAWFRRIERVEYKRRIVWKETQGV